MIGYFSINDFERRALEPGVDCCKAAVGEEWGHGEAAGGARVSSEDPGDDADLDLLVGGEAGVVEVERGGEPEVAPSGGERLGADGVLGGEEGDDLTEDGVGEAADAVDAIPFFSSRDMRWFLAAGCRLGMGRIRRRRLQLMWR